jgi:Phosphoenolpyruvate carboxykinase N-terminal domain
VAGVFSGALGSERRCAGGRPDVYLLAFEGHGGADEQLGGSLRDAKEAEAALRGAMRGRTMYVLPYSMGPIGGPMSQTGVQLMDLAYGW